MEDEWEPFEVFGDQASAAALVGLLRSEGVPTRIDARSPMPGLNESVRVMVPKSLAHRARWVVAGAAMTDAELDFIATGEFSGAETDSEQ
jgi:hypothetical protein